MIDKDNNVELCNDVAYSIEKGIDGQVYIKPQLTCFGDVRDITLGGSVPGGESLGGCIPLVEPGCPIT